MLNRIFVWTRWAFACLCLVWAVVYGLSYLRIVSEPHAYEQASRWMYRHIPAGSGILNVHWDDHLPISLPGYSPGQFGYRVDGSEWELPLYEPDTPAKLQEVSTKLANADFLVFPTARIPGSIPRRPDTYPQTTLLLQLLFAEKLGYRAVYHFKVNPRVGAWSFPNEQADESITVYDHPAVVVFKNVERLSAEQISARVFNSSSFGPLPTREEILRLQAGSKDAPTVWHTPEIVQVVLWLLILEVLTLASWPLFASLFFRAPDCGFGMAKVGGVLLVSYGTWLLHRFQIITHQPGAVWLMVAIVGLVGWLTLLRHRRRWGELVRATHGEWLKINVLFWSVFGVIALIRAFQPEIFWGEKPMDFTFLNFFERVETLPPQDPWAAGSTMNYYYFGVYALALLHKLSGVDSAIGYNLCVATIGAWLVAVLYSLFRSLSRTILTAMLGALAVTLLSNFEWVRLAFVENKTFNFDLFWASTRLFTSPSFAEYPWWSLLFADVHAHVIALPFFAFFLTVLLSALLGDRYENYDHASGRHAFFGKIALLALCMSTLFMMNTWDFISAAACLALLMTFSIAWVCTSSFSVSEAVTHMRTLLGATGLLVVLAGLLGIPFVLGVPSGTQVHVGWVTYEEFNTLSQILRHFGVWLIPLSFGLVFLLTNDSNNSYRTFSLRIILPAFILSMLPLVLSAWSYSSGNILLPWGIIITSCVLTLFSALLAFDQTREREVRAIGWSGTFIGITLTAVELVFLIDRMNTIFKFFGPLWIICGIGAVMASSVAYERIAAVRIKDWADSVVQITWFIIPLCGAVALAGSIIFGIVIAAYSRVDGPRFTLNGMAYLERQNADEAKLLSWIRTHVEGTPTILEAWGISYGPFTRVSMNTGLPTVLGWEHHVRQRGLNPQELARRRRLIEAIYRGPNLEEVSKLINRNGIHYIVVGNLERSTYGSDLSNRWLARPDLFDVVKREGNTILFSPRPS